ATQQGAGQVVLVNLVAAGTVVHDPERCAVGDDALGVGVFLVQLEVAGGALAARAQARSAGVLVDLGIHVVQQPDVGAVGGDSLDLRVGAQPTSGPGAQERATDVVDVDVLVHIRDPEGRAGGVGGDTARVQVVKAQSIRHLLGAIGQVFVRR